MLIIWARDVKIALADVVDRLVVDKERAVGVFDRAVGRKDSIVWFDDRRGHLWCWVDSEL